MRSKSTPSKNDTQNLILEARSVHKTYQVGEGKVTALHSIDLAIYKGEFIAVMGPSGCGKSTLLYLLGGLDQPTSGELMLAGRNLGKLNDNEITLLRRQQIGFIFQFFNLIPTLTAEENVALPLLIGGSNLKAHRHRISDLLELVGLQDRRNHKPDQLSGGQQQRVAIARALVTEPAIILGDEPTGNLDSKTGIEILELIRRSCDEFDQTLVIVTHNPEVASYADRVIFLKDGRIVDQFGLDDGRNTDTILRRFSVLEGINV